MTTLERRRETSSPAPSRCDFTPLAATYDDWFATPRGQVYDRLEKCALDALLPRDGEGGRLLDVGCGTGHWSALFAARNYRVTGVDVAPAMLRVARAKRIPGASFEHADAHALPFAEGLFAAAAAVTTLEFVRDAERVLAEMVRCTASGGTVLVGVLNRLAPVNIERKRRGAPPWHAARFFSPAELYMLLADHGDPEVLVTTFVPRARWARPFTPLADWIGRHRHARRGAFLVGRIIR